jgi:hypothetical protein
MDPGSPGSPPARRLIHDRLHPRPQHRPYSGTVAGGFHVKCQSNRNRRSATPTLASERPCGADPRKLSQISSGQSQFRSQPAARPAGQPKGWQVGPGGRRTIGKSTPTRSTADRDFPALAANVDPPEPPEDWPDIPDQRPRSSRERTRVALQVAEWIVRNAWRATPWGRAITIGHWLYDRHHIVERSTARLSGFSEDMIQ